MATRRNAFATCLTSRPRPRRGDRTTRPPADPDGPAAVIATGPPLHLLLIDREHPHDPALGDVLLPAEEIGKQTLLEGGIDAPAGSDADVLDAVDSEGDRRRRDAGVRAELPQHFARACVEGAEVPIAGTAAEDKPAGRRQHGAP